MIFGSKMIPNIAWKKFNLMLTNNTVESSSFVGNVTISATFKKFDGYLEKNLLTPELTTPLRTVAGIGRYLRTHS